MNTFIGTPSRILASSNPRFRNNLGKVFRHHQYD